MFVLSYVDSKVPFTKMYDQHLSSSIQSHFLQRSFASLLSLTYFSGPHVSKIASRARYFTHTLQENYLSKAIWGQTQLVVELYTAPPGLLPP